MHFRFQQEMKIKVSMRLNPHRATVHRTVTFDCSNPSPKTKSPTPKGVGLFVASLAEMNLQRMVTQKKLKRKFGSTTVLCA